MIPSRIPNYIGGEERPGRTGEWFEKRNPATGTVLCHAARSVSADIADAVTAAMTAQGQWAATPGVQRGLHLHDVVRGMQDQESEIANVVSEETGKSRKDALAETRGAIALGLFFSSEGQRLYGRTTTSAIPNRHVMTVRQPIGIAGLIVPANTPIANVAWKVFPALVCGNSAVLKSAEDSPATAWIFAQIAHRCGLPPGVLNVVHGYGEEAGAPLVDHQDVSVVSFTGSTAVGRAIQRAASSRFARVSLELGGKNPFVVCDDADLDLAVKWAQLSAFSNAGQRCAAGSRLIVFESIYEAFRDRLVESARRLSVGPDDSDDLGPVINEKQLNSMHAAVTRARTAGATVLMGGSRLSLPKHPGGYYLAPTLLEAVDPDSELSTCELFGPIAALYRAADFSEALALANRSPYGLTACIHTRSLDRALTFVERVQAGVVMVNAGTFGSEPHMPFGGTKQSGNGTREPGTEALDVYSQLKDVYIAAEPSAV